MQNPSGPKAHGPPPIQLQIKTLGGLSINLCDAADGCATALARPLYFDARSAEALLVYLACSGRPLARETLAETFWPERSQEQARTNLRGALHRLRRHLEPYLLITRQSVACPVDVHFLYLDSRAFESAYMNERFADAVALYQGDFLQGFYLDGSPLFEEWVLVERERLRNLAIAAHQHLILQASTAGQVDIAILAAERLLQLDPLHEPTHRHLMRLLLQTGQRTAALAHYASFRQLLARELDVPPDESTTALYEQIRTGELDHAGETRGTAGLSPAQLGFTIRRPHNNLPVQSTTFIGREAELAEIRQILSNPDCRLLNLLGLGGVGKSRLAIAAAAQMAQDFADGVCFVALAPVATADLLPVAIAQSLGLQVVQGDLCQQLVTYLQAPTLLLVLDNFEHLTDATKIVVDILQHAPHVKFLVTARVRLHLREEWLLPVAGLRVEEGAAGEAGQLFLRAAQQVRPGFTPHGHETAIVAICQQVEGMPLALELAASWTRAMPCAEIARQLRYNPEILTTSLSNFPERHRSLDSLFDHSWRFLTPAEQRTLRGLSVFRGGWTLTEASECTGTTISLLAGLVDKSLVRLRAGERYDLHELVRQYAAKQLAMSGEDEIIQARHFAVYLQLAREADRQLRGLAAASGYARLEPEQDNLRVALQWALKSRRFVDAAWLVVALAHFWSVRGHWHDVNHWLEQLLPYRDQLHHDLRLAVLLTAYHFWRGEEAFHLIERYKDELLQLQSQSENKLLAAVAWRSLAVAEADFAQAVAAWERCLECLAAAKRAQVADGQYGVYDDRIYQHAFALFRYAIRLTDMGDYARAQRLSAESLMLFRRIGNQDYIAFPLGNLGRLALLRGDLVQARLLLKEAVEIAAKIGNKMGLLDWQPRLAIAELYSGDVAAACSLLQASLQLCLELNNEMYLSRVYTYLAETALWQGEQDQAARWLTQSVAHHANLRWVRTELADCLWLAARIAMRQQDFRRAATLFGLAEHVSHSIGYALVGPVRVQVEEALAAVQDALPDEIFADKFATGRQLPLEDAFVTLLASL